MGLGVVERCAGAGLEKSGADIEFSLLYDVINDVKTVKGKKTAQKIPEVTLSDPHTRSKEIPWNKTLFNKHKI